MKYNVVVKTKARNLSKAVGCIEDELNKSMNIFGHGENVYLETEIILFNINAEDELTEDQKSSILDTIDEGLQEKFGDKYKCVRLEMEVDE